MCDWQGSDPQDPTAQQKEQAGTFALSTTYNCMYGQTPLPEANSADQLGSQGSGTQ